MVLKKAKARVVDPKKQAGEKNYKRTSDSRPADKKYDGGEGQPTQNRIARHSLSNWALRISPEEVTFSWKLSTRITQKASFWGGGRKGILRDLIGGPIHAPSGGGRKFRKPRNRKRFPQAQTHEGLNWKRIWVGR